MQVLPLAPCLEVIGSLGLADRLHALAGPTGAATRNSLSSGELTRTSVKRKRKKAAVAAEELAAAGDVAGLGDLIADEPQAQMSKAKEGKLPRRKRKKALQLQALQKVMLP